MEPGRQGIFFVGTATTLIRCARFTILTDPNFLHRGGHARLGWGLRAERLTDPAIEIDDLPALDFVLLSHHHGDHFDDVAAERLDRDLPIVTTPHGAEKLTDQGFRAVTALDTWQSTMMERSGSVLRVTAMPGVHGPGLARHLVPPVMGSMLEFQDGDARAFTMYVTGDTLMHDGIVDIARRSPDIDLALLHLGGTKVAGLLLTMDAAQGVELLRTVRPRVAIPIHYDDYAVFRSPLSEFLEAVRAADLRETVVRPLARGQLYRFELPGFDQRRVG
ncbi:MAG TPA: MBL fold metallo-hydrolase [Actinomycetota bacterium]|nr:MBL fold metallo-hydrolase [Actinomycetota bacterium]